MIPLTFTAQTIGHLAATKQGDRPQGGACLIAPAGEHPYLLVMASGDEAIRTYAQSGGGSFSLVPSAQTGLVASGTGVACTVGDFDNDGLPDVAVAMSDRVLLFMNHGGGKFTDVTGAAGVQPANQPAGITFVDYDHDGDLDLLITEADGPARLLRNDNGNRNDMLRVKLVGTRSNRDGIGAKLTLQVNSHLRLLRMAKSGSGYLSQSEFPVTFGLGKPDPTRRMGLTIVWPSGQKDAVANIKPNQSITVQEGKGIVASRVIVFQR